MFDSAAVGTTKMDKTLVEVVIGAFLHDIGKIGQRANIALTQETQRLDRFICPQHQGRYSHRHVLYTSQFFESMHRWLPDGIEPAKVASVASYHHSPSDELQLIVQQADWLSAGQDRGAVRCEEEETGSRHRSDRMQSIFRTLLEGSPGEYEIPFLPLTKIEAFKRTIDPRFYSQRNRIIRMVLGEGDATDSQDEAEEWTYTKIYESLVDRLAGLRQAPLSIWFDELCWVYMQYTWCIPSSLVDYPDIALIDHSLSTAAFAAALYQYHVQTESLESTAIVDMARPKFRLVSGDLSGIQGYIYHATRVQPKAAGKRLRARSFYLGLLTEMAARMILDELGLPNFNRIVNAGGRFLILAPNTESTLQKLREAQRRIDRWFYDTCQGLLGLHISFDLEAAGGDFLQAGFSHLQRKLAWHTERRKLTPFAGAIQDDGKWKGSTFRHERIAADGYTDGFFESLGSCLPRADSVCIGPAEGFSLQGLLEDRKDNPFATPFGYYSFDIISGHPREFSGLTHVLELVPPPTDRTLDKVRYGWLTAAYLPKVSSEDLPIYEDAEVKGWLAEEEADQTSSLRVGDTKTFSHLAIDALLRSQDGRFRGEPLLAVLKTDVDRLGYLFANGFGNKASIGRIVSLSRQVDFFFKAVLPALLPKPVGPGLDFRNIYIVYTGGDDLLTVGPWNLILRFAAFLQDAFRAFVFDTQGITISAGIAIFSHRTPLIQAVLQADDALENAKDSGRDRVCVFGQTLRWQDYKQALDDGQFLDSLIADSIPGIAVSKALVYRLLKYARMAQDTSRWHNLGWRSKMAYDLKRNVTIRQEDPQAEQARQRLERMTVLSQDRSSVDRLIVSTTFCLYQNRGGLLL